MSTEDNKALVRRLLEEGWNQGNVAVSDELFAPNFIFHEPAFPQVRTREDGKRWLVKGRGAFPDLHLTVDDMIAEGDQVAGRVTLRGTPTTDLVTVMHIPATSKQVTATGIVIARIANDKFVEIWHQLDWLGWRQQLGLIPARGQTS